jgi:hypothetical protein
MVIKDYCILMSSSMKGLEKKVKKSFKEDWQPIGGYRSFKRSYGVFYTQTMVKYENR